MATTAKKKPGKIVRIDPALERLVEAKRRGRESVSATLRRLVGLPSRKGGIDVKVFYVLPSHAHASIEEARGAAVLEKIRQKKTKAESPIELREII